MYTYGEENVELAAGRLAIELVNRLLPQALQGVDGLDKICDGGDFTSYEAGLAALQA
ncbi:MAG: hypothetical protein H7245_21425 [Candidatus Saccharibacteria bacterium]|nr:hypothetical protein [Pseudorhodobacter sp.]